MNVQCTAIGVLGYISVVWSRQGGIGAKDLQAYLYISTANDRN